MRKGQSGALQRIDDADRQRLAEHQVRQRPVAKWIFAEGDARRDQHADRIGPARQALQNLLARAIRQLPIDKGDVNAIETRQGGLRLRHGPGDVHLELRPQQACEGTADFWIVVDDERAWHMADERRLCLCARRGSIACRGITAGAFAHQALTDNPLGAASFSDSALSAAPPGHTAPSDAPPSNGALGASHPTLLVSSRARRTDLGA